MSLRSTLAMLAVVVVATTGCDHSSTTTTLSEMSSTAEPDESSPSTATETTAANEPAKATADPGPTGKLVDKTFDDMKFDIEPDEPFEREMLTDEIVNLDGQRIRIRGYMYPTMQRSGITQFVLVRDNLECCFGPGAALFDCIFVEMEAGKTADFSARPIAVEGTFSIDEVLGLDGTHLAIYHLDGEQVR
ncbi:DUF3299 domain-containing protein [Aeoliella mucimassa]|uniref:DUF3299 domain-containing protein n=1 Tax=Aeoliella mucimassa TaxID=2527972 RepID=UPI0018D39994|nr:DUF3299 domain-containing protein [Aeoliella mucimassa]